MSHYHGKRIHFVGIGGIGMSGIAEILLRSGYSVSGSDLKENHETKKLASLGATILSGHRAENVKDADVVVVSSAIRETNPELVEAKNRHLTILPRAEMLAELMRKKKSIVVAGAHGKTTTTSMIAALLMESGFDPTAVIGGRLRNISGNAKMGTDDWFVAESDESDGSFLKLLPTIAVITNLDLEHLDHYGSYEKLEQAFIDFANRVPFDGTVIACRDDTRVARILSRFDHKVVTYGFSEGAPVRGLNVKLEPHRSLFDVEVDGKKLAAVSLPVVGRHNVLNALAAAAVGIQLELSGKDIAKGLGSFKGIDRRLEWKGDARGIHVIDDYAHHPTEIRATLEAVRLIADGGKVRVLFQPHRYTRVRDLWEAFVSVFDLADEVVVCPIYAASENPLAGIDSERLAKDIRARKKTDARVVESVQQGAEAIAESAKPRDVLLTMGAGDVTYASKTILEALSSKRAGGGAG